MTIFSVLKQEHRNINKLFADLIEPPEDGDKTRAETFQLLKQELLSHAEAERKSLYDRLADEPATHDMIMKSEDEHQDVAAILLDMEAMPNDDPHWVPKLIALKAHVDDHVVEEEKVIFPRAKAILEKTEQLEIAEDFRDRKYFLLETWA